MSGLWHRVPFLEALLPDMDEFVKKKDGAVAVWVMVTEFLAYQSAPLVRWIE